METPGCACPSTSVTQQLLLRGFRCTDVIRGTCPGWATPHTSAPLLLPLEGWGMSVADGRRSGSPSGLLVSGLCQVGWGAFDAHLGRWAPAGVNGHRDRPRLSLVVGLEGCCVSQTKAIGLVLLDGLRPMGRSDL